MKDFFKDEAGKYSSTRLAFLVWVLGMFIVWAVISLKKMEIAGIPWENILLIGMLMTGKVVQLWREFKGIKPS